MVISLLIAALMANKLPAAAQQAAMPATVEVRATDDIFAAGLDPGDRLKRDMGTLPQAIPVTPGQVLELSASGKIGCCGVAQVKVDADGYPDNPFNGAGSHISNPLHTRVSSFVDPAAAFMLVGVFDDGAISRSDIFEVGRDKRITVPPGASKLYLGFADAPGFNGPAGNYGDNTGSLTVTNPAHALGDVRRPSNALR